MGKYVWWSISLSPSLSGLRYCVQDPCFEVPPSLLDFPFSRNDALELCTNSNGQKYEMMASLSNLHFALFPPLPLKPPWSRVKMLRRVVWPWPLWVLELNMGCMTPCDRVFDVFVERLAVVILWNRSSARWVPLSIYWYTSIQNWYSPSHSNHPRKLNSGTKRKKSFDLPWMIACMDLTCLFAWRWSRALSVRYVRVVLFTWAITS